MSFADQMKSIAIISEQEQQANNLERQKIKEEKLKKRQAEVKEERFKALSEKYLKSIHDGIKRAAEKGKTEKYINLKREDFKANCPGLGGVVAFQNLWLSEVANPDSQYLVEDSEGNKIHISGIKWDIWNNGAFTTVFSW